MPPYPILSFLSQILFYGSAVAYCLAALKMRRHGLIDPYPVLFSFTLVSGILHGALSLIPTTSPEYRAAYPWACLCVLLLEAGTVVELFWALASKFRKFAVPGGIVLGVLAVIGISASAAIRLSWIPSGWHGSSQMALLAVRHCSLAMGIVLFGSWVILRWPGLPMKANASRASLVVAGYLIYEWILSSWMIYGSGRHWRGWQLVLPLAGTFVCASCLLGFLSRDAEECEDVKPVPDEELQESLRRCNQNEKDLARGVRAVWRNVW